MKRTKGHAKSRGAGTALAFGIIFNAVLFVIVTFFASLIISRFNNPTGSMGMMSMLALYICALISGFSVAKFKGEGGALPSVMSSLIFTLILLTVGLILSKGGIPFVTAVNYIVYVLLSIGGALIACKRSNRRRRTR